MGKFKDCQKNENTQRLFDIPIVFEQELAVTPNGLVPLSLIPGVINPGLTGHLLLKFDKTLTQMKFKLFVCSNNNNPSNFIISTHLHIARANANGPIVVGLFESPTPAGVVAHGRLAEGIITNGNINLNTSVKSVAGLFDAIRRGEIYVNVHTLAIPSGAIRGQIFPSETTA